MKTCDKLIYESFQEIYVDYCQNIFKNVFKKLRIKLFIIFVIGFLF